MMRNEEKGAACAFGMCFQGLLWGAADLWTWPGGHCLWWAGEVAACPLWRCDTSCLPGALFGFGFAPRRGQRLLLEHPLR